MICEESVVAFFQDEGVLGFFSEQVLRYVPRREFDTISTALGPMVFPQLKPLWPMLNSSPIPLLLNQQTLRAAKV